ncbi:uncharacterized protein BJ212DRAFT_1336179 [Suillus subaureus]|uniref:Uncharacterized protein n=1 Tax=Suillus subaureus TaxID=48587 RepID=A0A9P7EGB9_9AGAM|nr:uncharacterized protein BJ212DRAFT_1336179 [Suillus subaureus]KAG1820893.1 hypothetical protein BJ212DRAFT_1336179 [Suillus subaureus]
MPSIEGGLDKINMQQSRTRGHPLSLKIICFKRSCSSLRPLLSSLDITCSNPIEYKTVLNDLPVLQELRVDMMDSASIHRCTLPISRLSALRTLEFKGLSRFNFASLPVLNPIWAHLSNLTLDSYEQGAVIRLLRLAPDLSSLTICLLLCYEFCPGPFTHTNIRSFSIKASQGRFRTCSRHALPNDPVAIFLNVLTLPNLRVLAVGTRSWTGEELRGVRSGTVEMAIDIEALVEDGHSRPRYRLASKISEQDSFWLWMTYICHVYAVFFAKVYFSVIHHPLCKVMVDFRMWKMQSMCLVSEACDSHI